MPPKSFDHLREIIAQDNVIELAKLAGDLVKHRGDVDINGRGLLHAAVHAQAGDALLWLLDHGTQDINRADNQGESPLMRAAWLGYTPAVEMLIQHGADLSQRSLSGGTPLHFAYAGGKIAQAAVATLLASGADPTAQDNSGNTPESWKSQAEIREEGAALLASSKSGRILSISRRSP